MNSSAPSKFPVLPKVINGSIGGVIGVAVVLPLDLIKIRLQNQQIGPNGEKMYKNMFDCFRKTYQAEGFFGLYRGTALSIVLIIPEKGVKLASNDYLRFHLTRKDGSLPLTHQMFAAGIAGIFQIIITTPMELLKIQLQDAGRIATLAKLAGKTVPKTTALQIGIELIKDHGIFGLYTGVLPTGVREISFSILFFPLFAFLNSFGPRKADGSGEAVFWCSFLAGLGAGAFTAFSVTPIDVIKTRMQAIKKTEGEKEFSGFADCITKTFKCEGPAAFFKGGLCRVIVIAPLAGIAQTVYYMGIGEWLLGVEKPRVSF